MTENFLETSHFYLIWKTSRPKNTRISFLHKTFQKTLKNTRIRILYPKNTTSIPIILPWKYNPRGAILTTVFICRSFAFCMTKRLSPQVEVKSRKTRKWNLPHSGKRLSFVIRRKSLTLKPIFTQGISDLCGV